MLQLLPTLLAASSNPLAPATSVGGAGSKSSAKAPGGQSLFSQTLGGQTGAAKPGSASMRPGMPSPSANALPRGSRIPGETDTPENAKLRKTANEFESVFLEQVYERMVSNLGEEGPMGANGAGGDIWRGMLSQQYAKSTVKAGGVGLSDGIYRELVRMQSGQGTGN